MDEDVKLLLQRLDEVNVHVGSLRRLDLSFNLISPVGMEYLARTLPTTPEPMLQDLNVSGNNSIISSSSGGSRSKQSTFLDALGRMLSLSSLRAMRMDHLGLGMIASRGDWDEFRRGLLGMWYFGIYCIHVW